MKDRKAILEALIKQPSILTAVIDSPTELSELLATSGFEAEIARRLAKQGTQSAKSRAAFIRQQDPTIFKANREAWGIPAFRENLVDLSDFTHGFLWRFRAHTTSWGENQYADEWFFTSLEARSVTRYEYWSCDDGPDKMEIAFTGTYKSILQELLAEHVHEVLISPVFSHEELARYMATFSEDEEGYSLADLLADYISRNPNYRG